MIRSISHHDFLMKRLKNATEAAAYLTASVEEGGLRYLLKALRNVVEAQGGIGRLSQKTKLNRTHLYRTLSPQGNPEISTLDSILKTYGIHIHFAAGGAHHHRKAA